MRFRDIQGLIDSIFEADGNYRGTDIHPGPSDPDSPDRYVLVTMYGGPGEDADGLLDQVSVQVRCIGAQNDYDDAEDMALLIDRSFLMFQSSRLPDGPWVASIQRVGGAPSPLMKDNAERTHFICSYILTEQMALVN